MGAFLISIFSILKEVKIYMHKIMATFFITAICVVLCGVSVFADGDEVKTIESGWNNQDITIKFFADPDTYSGQQKVEYRINGSEWLATASLEQITLDTSTTLQLKSTDNAGNVSYSDKYYYKVNKIAPSAPTINNVDSNVFYNTERTITITDGADMSGTGCEIDKTEYHVDTSDVAFDAQNYWTIYTQPIVIKGDTKIEARSTDKAGNISTTRTVNIQFDYTSPTAVIRPEVTTMTNTPFSLVLTGEDVENPNKNIIMSDGTIVPLPKETVSGVEYVRVSGGDWIKGNSLEYTVRANGAYTFDVKDKAGNVTTVAYTVTNFDITKPVVYGVNVPVTTATTQTVTVNGADERANALQYSISTTGAPAGWQTSNKFSIGSNGTYYAFIKDSVGNISAAYQFAVNSVKPAVIVNGSISGYITQSPVASVWTNGNVKLTASATDSSSSGIKSVLMPNGATQVINNTNAIAKYTDWASAEGRTYYPNKTVEGADQLEYIREETRYDVGPWSGTQDSIYPPTAGDTCQYVGGYNVQLYTPWTYRETDYNPGHNGVTVSYLGSKQVFLYSDKTSGGSPVSPASNGNYKSVGLNYQLSDTTYDGGWTNSGNTKVHLTIRSREVYISKTYERKLVRDGKNSVWKAVHTGYTVGEWTYYYNETYYYKTVYMSNQRNYNGVEHHTLFQTRDYVPYTYYFYRTRTFLNYSTATVDYTVSQNGEYSFTFKNGNGAESKMTISVTNIDKTAPSSPLIVNTPAGWSNDTVVTKLSATDVGSGVAKYQYSLNNGGTWTDCGAEITWSADMNQNVIFRAIDYVGNSGGWSAVWIGIDKKQPTAPTITARNTAGQSIAAGNWSQYALDLNITRNSTAVSGIAYYEYSLNGGESWIRLADNISKVTFAENTTTDVRVRAVSGSGMKGVQAIFKVMVDVNDPTKPQYIGKNTSRVIASGVWSNTPLTMTYSGSAAFSGIAKYQFSYNGTNWYDCNSAGAVVIQPTFNTPLYGRAVSVAGRTSVPTDLYNLRVDTVALAEPTITAVNAAGAVGSGQWSPTDLTVKIGSLNAFSGISGYEYSTDGGKTWNKQEIYQQVSYKTACGQTKMCTFFLISCRYRQ